MRGGTLTVAIELLSVLLVSTYSHADDSCRNPGPFEAGAFGSGSAAFSPFAGGSGDGRVEKTSDSLLHFLGGASAGLLVSACLTAFDTGRPLLETGGALAGAAAAGTAKEALDALGFGVPDAFDFLWTLAGGAAAAVLVEFVRSSGHGAGTRAAFLALYGVEFSLPLAAPFAGRFRAGFRTSR